MPQVENALVVGAGIAGCAAAIALAERGVEVELVDQQEEWRFASSGIFIYSNGLESLRRLGVLPDILERGFPVEDGRNVYLDHEGAHIVDTFYPAGLHGVPPVVGIRRAEMHRVLAGRLAELGVPVRLGLTADRLGTEAGGGRAFAELSDGSVRRVDLVVGADGIRSRTRSLVAPGVEPRYAGFGVWRSVHARPPALDAKIMLMGVGKRLGIMPISQDQLYLFGTVPEPAGHWHPREEWPARMRAAFVDFGGPARPFLDQLSAGSEVLYTAVEEVVAPLPWHRGRVVLIGDAVHASTPFMGQGGAMALEDGVLLAASLDGPGDVESCLRGFGLRRAPRCSFVQDASRRVGEAGAVEDAASCRARNASMAHSAQGQVDDFYRALDEMRIHDV